MTVFKKYFIAVTILMFCFVGLNAQQIAFPGAEGYGKYASGGRGNGQNGKIAIVTNLEDDLENPPEGSLRWALQQGTEVISDPILGNYTVTRPLTIVFQVGGVIHLKGDLRGKRNNLTIAGQTAPGDGICIRGATVNLGGSFNVIIRYIRFRPGDESGGETSALRIENGGNFIIDHCSMSWGIEEITHFSSSENLTVQWCIVSEALYNSIHKKGPRGYAAQWGGEYASYHHNLLAHNNSRMPRINGSNENDIEALVDYRNNVNFNWGSSGAFYGGEFEATPDCSGFSHVNLVNSYFKPGPATQGNLIASPSTNREGRTLCGYAKWFVDGNFMAGKADITADNWLGISFSAKDSIKKNTGHVKSDGVIEGYDNYTQSAENAFQSVLDFAGAILPARDVIDERIVKEVRGEIDIVRYPYVIDGQSTPMKGTESGIIDTQRNLVPENAPEGTTAWDVYTTSTEAPVDTDKDGMPDDWEKANNLNPNDFNDFRKIAANGFSNLENYLNAADILVSSNILINKASFKIYPNPVSDILQIQCTKNINLVIIYDVFGKEVNSVSSDGGIYNIDTNNLKSGIFFMKASTSNQETFYRKFIKI